MQEHIDVMREAARRLGRPHLADRLTQWPQQRPQGDFRVAFVGRGPHKTHLVHRLLALSDAAADPLSVPVRFDHGPAGPVTVQFGDGSSVDTTLAALPVTVFGRDPVVVMTRCEAVPVGVQWCDTPALSAYGRAADLTTLETLRYCDAVILAIAATDPPSEPVDAADLAILEHGAVLDGHVPVVVVVVTGTADLPPDAAADLLGRIAGRVHAVCRHATVCTEPPPGTAEHSAWRDTFLAAQPPEDLGTARRSQADAQLRDIGEQLVTAAEDCAVDEHRHIGTGTAVLAEVQTRAEWLLDAGGVRRELRVRRQRVMSAAIRDLDRLALELADRAGRLLAVSTGPGSDAAHIPQDLRARTDTTLIRVREQFHRTVAADIAWLDNRLRAYFEAWTDGLTETGPVSRAGSGPLLERYVPRMHPAWSGRATTIPLDVFGEVGAEMLRSLPGNPQPGRSGTSAARRFAVEALTARRSAGTPTGDASAARTAADGDGRGGARVAVAPGGVALATGGGSLGAITDGLYGALADEFEVQRRRWRRTQVDGVDRIRRAAYAEWRALAAQLRDLVTTAPVDRSGSAHVIGVPPDRVEHERLVGVHR